MKSSARQIVLRLTASIGSGISILVIQMYRVVIAPLLVGGCRHWPSCSHYAEEAIRRHGLRDGWKLAVRRIARCRPGGSYGYDPVPESPSPQTPLTGHLL